MAMGTARRKTNNAENNYQHCWLEEKKGMRIWNKKETSRNGHVQRVKTRQAQKEKKRVSPKHNFCIY